MRSHLATRSLDAAVFVVGGHQAQTTVGKGLAAADAHLAEVAETLKGGGGAVDGGEGGDYPAPRPQPGSGRVEHGQTTSPDEDPVGIGKVRQGIWSGAFHDLDAHTVTGGIGSDAHARLGILLHRDHPKAGGQGPGLDGHAPTSRADVPEDARRG